MQAREFTEKTLQYALASHYLGKLKHIFAVPNVHFLQGESDLITVTKSRYIHEFEIKLSRADFYSEFREKKEKHDLMRVGLERNLPNYFWFVYPKGIIDKRDIPMYAGVIEVRMSKRSNRLALSFVRKAPLLHSEIATDNNLIKLGRKMMYRYWNMEEG